MTHPLDTIFQTGVAVSKGDFKDYARKTFLADSATQVSNTDLAGTLFILCPVSTGLGLFVYDSGDTTSAQDVAAGILRSNDGRVYKRKVLAQADIQSFVLAAITAAGGIASANIADGTANTLLGRDGSGEGADITALDLVALLDGAIGSSAWRSEVENAKVASIAKLPENKMSGYLTLYVLMQDGRVRATGEGAAASAGIENNADALSLTAIGVVGGSPTFTRIFSGGSQCYAIDSDGYPWAMGQNNFGQLGLGDTVNRYAFEEITYFRTNSIAVTDIALLQSTGTSGCIGAVFLGDNGKAYYVGENSDGQAGDGGTVDKTTPVPWGDAYTSGGVTDIDGIWASAVGASGGVVFASRTNGNVIAAGYDANGSFGLGTNSNARSTPVLLTAVSNVAQIVSDGFFTAYRQSDGTLKTGGFGTSGQRGDGTTAANTSPAYELHTVSLGGDCLDVQCGHANTFTTVAAIVETAPGARTLKIWGYNAHGAVGDGTTTNRSTPYTPVETWVDEVDEVLIAGFEQFGSVFARVGNAIYSVGYNLRQNLVRPGTGTTNQTTFGPVAGVYGTIQQMHASGYSSYGALIVRTDKTTLAGGQDSFGKLGINGVSGAQYSTLQDIVVPNPTGLNPVASPPAFTVATLPAATAYPLGTNIYVSDEAGGAVTAFTDGTNWRRVTDRAIVS